MDTKIVDRMIEEYRGAAGVTYRVRWRDGGTRTGKPRTVTLATLAAARTLRGLVELCGRTMPTRAQLLAHGLAELVPDAPAPTSAMTVTDVCEAYLTDLAARPAGKRPSVSSMETYRRHLNLYVAPTALGSMVAELVGPLDIEAWQRELERAAPGRRPLGVNSVRAVRGGLVGPAFKWATSTRSTPIGRRLLDRANPVPDALLPGAQRFTRAILETPDEYALMLAHARAIQPRWGDLLLVEAATGLRWCEAITLDAADVVTRRARLRVTRHLAAGQVVAGTKSGVSYTREVPLPAVVLHALAGRSGLLLPAVYGARWSGDSHMWTKLRKRMADDGFPVHLTHHSLRHGIATWWGSRGIDPAKRDALLGHAPRTVGDGYSYRLTETDHARVRAATEELLEQV